MNQEQNFDLAQRHNEKEIDPCRLLRNIFENHKPLAKMITTPSGYYLYDTGTNKILGCREEVYELICGLFNKDVNRARQEFISKYDEQTFNEAAGEIACAIQGENILQLKKMSGFGLSDHLRDIEEVMNSSLQSINLETTTACNLRCRYCPYNDYIKGQRNHSSEFMSIETAQKSIDFLKEHSFKNNKVAIAFYGGEPLLRFPFIKKSVHYAREIMDKQEILFTTTTNATLIDQEIAEFLLKENFSVLVSLDGPVAYHDRYRKTNDGKGSFDKTLRGLKILADKYREIRKGAISINVVYTPPYSEDKLNCIELFFKELDWLPEINVITVYPSGGTIPSDMVTDKDLEQDKDMMQWALEKYLDKMGKSSPMVKGIIEKQLSRLMKRQVYSQPIYEASLNGCCHPGQRKSFISVDGHIHICEKISVNAPVIGHVNTGFNFEAIKKIYINEYAEKSYNDCSGCWGLRLCDLCYQQVFNAEGEMDMGKKRKYCGFHLQSLHKTLQDFIALLEAEPGKLDYLYQYEIT